MADKPKLYVTTSHNELFICTKPFHDVMDTDVLRIPVRVNDTHTPVHDLVGLQIVCHDAGIDLITEW